MRPRHSLAYRVHGREVPGPSEIPLVPTLRVGTHVRPLCGPNLSAPALWPGLRTGPPALTEGRRVVARSPDRATGPDRRSPIRCRSGDLRSRTVAGSGDPRHNARSHARSVGTRTILTIHTCPSLVFLWIYLNIRSSSGTN